MQTTACVVLVCVLAVSAVVSGSPDAEKTPPSLPKTLAATVKGRSAGLEVYARVSMADTIFHPEEYIQFKSMVKDLTGKEQTQVMLSEPRSESSVGLEIDPATDTCTGKKDPDLLPFFAFMYPDIYDGGCTLSESHVPYAGVDCDKYTCKGGAFIKTTTLYFSTDGQLPMGGSLNDGEMVYELSEHTTEVDVSSMTKYVKTGPCMNPPADLLHPGFTAVYSFSDKEDTQRTIFAAHHQVAEGMDSKASLVRQDVSRAGKVMKIGISNGPKQVSWTYHPDDDPETSYCHARMVWEDVDEGLAFLTNRWMHSGTDTYRDAITGEEAECDIWSDMTIEEEVKTSCIADGQAKWLSYSYSSSDLGSSERYTLKSYKPGTPDASVFAKPSDKCPDHPDVKVQQ